jgi:hypothetical protein
MDRARVSVEFGLASSPYPWGRGSGVRLRSFFRNLSGSEVLAPVVPDDGDEEVGASGLRARFAAVKVGPDEMARADERSVWRE